MDSPDLLPLPPSTSFSPALTCQKCGCHDPSVRQVIYPYVVSVFVLTFRLEFHGRWCRKHRLLYLLLAAVITATVGWLGFPFGLVYTPVALFRLAKGGGLHKASNLKLMRSLAEAHQQRGLLDGARRCLENGLQFVDDLWGRQELERSYLLSAASSNAGGAGFFRPPLGALWLAAGSALLSGLAGLASHYVELGLNDLLGDMSEALGLVLLWLPFVALCTALIFSLRQLQERVLDEHPYRNPLAILGLALLAGLLAAYGFMEGREVGYFFDMLGRQPVLPAGLDLVTMLGAVLTRGGILAIPQALGDLEYWQYSQDILQLALPLLFPLTLLLAAWPSLRWEKTLHEVRAQVASVWDANQPALVAQLAPFLAVLCLAGAALLLPQQSMVDFIEARDHLYRGNALMDEEDYPRAISEYQRAVQLDPNYVMAYANMGWAYYEQDDNAQAIAQYTRALALKPDLVSGHYDLGKIYYNDDQLEKATLEFEKTIQLDPGYYYAYLGTGWVAYDQGDLDKAERSFRKVLEYDDQEYDAYLGLGYIYTDRGQLDEEIAAYQKLVASDDTSSEAHMLLGLAYYDKNELDLAVTSLEKAVDLERDNRLARQYLTQAYVYTGNPDKAVSFSQQTLKLLPEWAGGHALLAFALIETRQLDGALDEIQAAQDTGEKTDSDRRLILRALLNADQAEEAETEAQVAIKDGQHPASFYLYLVEAYQNQEKYDLALAACDQAGKAGARPGDVLTHRASVHLNQEQADLSLEELRQALQLDPKSSYAHYLLSVIYDDRDDLANALDEAQQSAALDRYSTGAYLRLASAHNALNHTGDAISAAARAAQLSPYADLPHFFLGMGYLQQGSEHMAGVELQKFLDLYDGAPEKQELKVQAEKELMRLNPSF